MARARTQDTATAFAGYGTGNRTPALVRYKNESINRLVTDSFDNVTVTGTLDLRWKVTWNVKLLFAYFGIDLR